MNNTDPNADFDTQGRVYQATLPFNPWWENFIHPDAAVGVSYSDDLGRTWVTGNGGNYLARSPNASSKTLGQVEDKQWIAVNHLLGTAFQDHVYAMWSVFNGSTSQIWYSVSRDRGQTFPKARRLTPPSEVGASNTDVYPSVDAAGNLYVAFASFPNPSVGTEATIYVTRSTDDATTWGPFVPVASAQPIPGCCLPNTTFRDGILEHFATSPSHPGHLYVTWEDWDGTQMDVMFSQSIDSGTSWSEPITVNDNVDGATISSSRRSLPGRSARWRCVLRPPGALRGRPCHRGGARRPRTSASTSRSRRSGTTAAAPFRFGQRPGHRVHLGPEQPDQTIDGIDQIACSNHQDPCTINALIGGYFGLAISDENVYGLFVSPHYPSTVIGDEGGPIFYQQHVLATVARSDLGLP